MGEIHSRARPAERPLSGEVNGCNGSISPIDPIGAGGGNRAKHEANIGASPCRLSVGRPDGAVPKGKPRIIRAFPVGPTNARSREGGA